MTANLKLLSLPAAVLAVAVMVSACGADNPDELIASAQSYLQRKDVPAAIIQLKNALKARPESAQARLLLGSALESSGDISGAATEYQKAKDFGAAADDVEPRLAHALLVQGKNKQLTTDFSTAKLTSAQAKADLQTTLALAWQRQGEIDKFQMHIDDALRLQPDHAPALVAMAQMKAAKGDAKAALALLDKVPESAALAPQAAKLRGDIALYIERDMDRALAMYQQSIQLQPAYVQGHEAIFQLLLAQNKVDAAAEVLQKLEKLAPNHPETLYLKAKMAYSKGDFKKAQETLQGLLRLAPDNPRVLELAGLTDFRLNAFAQAETSLLRALQLVPGMPMAQRGLVLSYAQTGQLDKAVAALPPDLEAQGTDAAMLSVAGQVYLLRGEVEHAQRLFAQAAKLDPDDPAKRTTLAASRLLTGDKETALGELQNIAASDAGTVADIALVNALLQRGEFGRALEALEGWEKKQPNDLRAPFLRGRVLLQQKDVAGARKSMERVLAMDENYFPAIELLAQLDNADKQPEKARARLEAVLKKTPGQVQAHVALLKLRIANGATPQEQADLLRAAVAAAPQSAALRLLLVEYHLRNKEPKVALDVAQKAVAAIPDDARLTDALGQAQTANGDHLLAQSTFRRMASLQPKSPLPHLRMANVSLAQGDRAEAAQNLRKALEIQPGLVQAQQGLVALALADKKPAQALALARDMQKQQPKSPLGYRLEGDIHTAEKALDKAAKAYRAGLAEQPDSTDLAVRLHSALLSTGAKDEAARWSESWLRNHPKDPAFSMYLGDRALASQDLKAALQHFERATQIQPGNAGAFNNMAWVKGRLKQPGALADAEKANALVPGEAAFMDTWAMLLSDAGQHEKAIDLQKQAVQLQPAVAPMKLNLAKIYLAAGQKEAARPLLDELKALGDKFGNQAEVAQLRAAL